MFLGQCRHPGLGGAAGGLVSSRPRHAVVRDCQNTPGGWRPVLANLANLRLAAPPAAGRGAAAGARAGVGGAAPGGGARPAPAAAGGRQVVRHGALHGDRVLISYTFHLSYKYTILTELCTGNGSHFRDPIHSLYHCCITRNEHFLQKNVFQQNQREFWLKWLGRSL